MGAKVSPFTIGCSEALAVGCSGTGGGVGIGVVSSAAGGATATVAWGGVGGGGGGGNGVGAAGTVLVGQVSEGGGAMPVSVPCSAFLLQPAMRSTQSSTT